MTVSARIKKERAIPVKFVNDYLLIGRLFGNRGTSTRRREKLALQDSIRQSGQGTCNTSKSAVHYYLLRRSLVLCLSVGDLMSYFFWHKFVKYYLLLGRLYGWEPRNQCTTSQELCSRRERADLALYDSIRQSRQERAIPVKAPCITICLDGL